MKSTITLKGIDFECIYQIEPEEKATSDTPYEPAYIDDIQITHQGTDFTDFLSDESYKIEKMLLELNGYNQWKTYPTSFAKT